MKTAKLVLGILSIIFSCLITFQSCAVGLSNTLKDNDEISGSAGLFVSILLLSGAITMIATRNKTSKGGGIAGIIIFTLAALLGFSNAGSYKDLKIWSGFCVILALINLISVIRSKKNVQNRDNDDGSE